MKKQAIVEQWIKDHVIRLLEVEFLPIVGDQKVSIIHIIEGRGTSLSNATDFGESSIGCTKHERSSFKKEVLAVTSCLFLNTSNEAKQMR